ncbi:uncharacterized protein LOC120494988 [Tachysurus ichikawai]
MQVNQEFGSEAVLRYTRDLLLFWPSHTITTRLPRELQVRALAESQGYGRGESGGDGGVRQRVRRRAERPPLSSVLLCNTRSLRSKVEELRVNTRVRYEYRDSCLLVFTETWLREDVPDTLFALEGFSLVRADRNDNSGKTKGGGICVYINQKWCSQFSARERVCISDIELLCLSLRPFYLPREFGNILLYTVYIPPSGKNLQQTVFTNNYNALLKHPVLF